MEKEQPQSNSAPQVHSDRPGRDLQVNGRRIWRANVCDTADRLSRPVASEWLVCRSGVGSAWGEGGGRRVGGRELPASS